MLFKYYPDLESAYKLSRKLSKIFEQKTTKEIAYIKLALWYNDVEASGFKSFYTIANTIKIHYNHILKYFNNRSTNASAEAFNTKVKGLRRQFRGVVNVEFFLYRLAKIYV
ncbi:MAG: transposase [Saprospiraceae bacterium]